jgi:3-hydroxybutyryl-CoA dehydratase
LTTMRRKAAQGLKLGDIFKVVRTFTQEDVEKFGAISKDYNPVHYEKRFCAVKGFSGPICHGLLVGNLACEIGGQLGWLASRFEFHFKRPVYVGDTVTCKVTIAEMNLRGRAKAEVEYVNQDGVLVMTAQLYGIVPQEPEREVLKAMMAEGDPTNKLNE